MSDRKEAENKDSLRRAGMHTAKAAIKLSTGDTAGAAAEATQAAIHFGSRILLVLLSGVLAIIIAMVLLICVILGTITSIGSNITSLFEGNPEDWSIEANYCEYEEKIERIYKKSYQKEIRQAAGNYDAESVVSAWENEYAEEIDGKDVQIYVDIQTDYAGMFGSDVYDATDDDVYTIQTAILDMITMYNLYNANLPESTDGIADEERVYDNITEDENYDSWVDDVWASVKSIIKGLFQAGQIELSYVFDSNFTDVKGYPTLRGMRKLIRQNTDSLFLIEAPTTAELLPGTLTSSGIETQYYSISLNVHDVQSHTRYVNGIESVSYSRKIDINIYENVIYTGETDFRNNVLVLPDEDYFDALGSAEGYATVLGISLVPLTEDELADMMGSLTSNVDWGELPEEEQNARLAVVSRAVAIVNSGIPYIWGGSDPRVGLDCSHFVYQAFKQAGLEISYTTTAGISGSPYYDYVGTYGRVTLLPGDVLWHPGHVAIYIGDGKVAEAASARTGLVIRERTDWTRVYRYNNF